MPVAIDTSILISAEKKADSCNELRVSAEMGTEIALWLKFRFVCASALNQDRN